MAATKTASKAAAKTVEVADVVEDIVETATDVVALTEERISWMKANPKALLLGVSVGGAIFGGALTYLIVSKRLQRKWQAFAEEQIASVKAHQFLITKTGPANLAAKYDTRSDDIVAVSDQPIDTIKGEPVNGPNRTQYNRITPDSQAVKDLVDKVRDSATPISSTPVVTQNIFESNDPEKAFDFEKELQRREEKPDEPFVITRDEYDANETDFEQYSFTYYDGDDVLCDQADNVITAIEQVVGYPNLLRFGHGSNDPETVFVRNNKLEQDMEIVRSEGSYAREVLGMANEPETAELKHSHNRRGRFHDE
jgi:hypothetical protein